MGSAATMSVCLSPCTVPGLGSSFILGENEIEMGLGIHGEAGAHRCQVLCIVMYVWRGWDSSLSGNVYSNVCMERLGLIAVR